MRAQHWVLVLLAVALPSALSQGVNRTFLARRLTAVDTEAVCNDGSPALYYLGDSNKGNRKRYSTAVGIAARTEARKYKPSSAKLPWT